jgi:hypothetical protein
VAVREVITAMQRSLAYLRDQGYHVQVVERWIPSVCLRQDLLHCIDILAFKDHVLAVQTTTINCISEHINKIRALPEFDIVKRVGWKFELHAWDNSVRGGRVKIVDLFTLETIMDDRVMTGRSSKARKLNQEQLL